MGEAQETTRPGSDTLEPGTRARDKVFDWFARFLYRLGLRPNHLTLLQVPVYVMMVLAGLDRDLLAFGLWQVVVMVLDGMDGTLARRMGLASRTGALLDAAFDLLGIVLVVVVAALLYPPYALWLWLALGANLLLYYQNYRLDEKAVSYVRGPVVLGIYLEVLWPGIFWFGILVPFAVAAIIVVVRAVVKPQDEPKWPTEGPKPYRPGFKAAPPTKDA